MLSTYEIMKRDPEVSLEPLINKLSLSVHDKTFVEQNIFTILNMSERDHMIMDSFNTRQHWLMDRLVDNFLSEGIVNSEDSHVAITVVWMGMAKQHFLPEAKGLFLKKLLLLRELILQKDIFTVWDLIEGKVPVLADEELCEEAGEAAVAARRV